MSATGMSDKSEQIVAYGVVAIGAYLVYKLVKGLEKVGGAAGTAVGYADDAGQALIGAPVGYAVAGAWKLWNWATNNYAAPSGNIVLPDGTLIPMSQVNPVTFNHDYNVATFKLGSKAYVIPQNPNGPSYDDQGNYHAVEWNTFIANPSGV